MISSKGSDPDMGSQEKDIGAMDVGVGVIDENAVHAEELIAGNSWYAKAQRLAGRFGVEQRGIERVPSDERTDTSLLKISTMWLSANMVISSFAIGALGIPVFGLGFVDSALAIIFFNILGIIPVCFFSTFGPKFGLRQMVLSRYYYGYYGVKLIALFNVLACLGWSSCNVIVGAQFFHAVNPSMPGWAGIIVIAVLTLLVCTFGYRIVHAYEKFAWIIPTVIFLIVLGEFAHSGKFSSPTLATGKGEAGDILSFAASIYGFATGWVSYASDYTVYQPPNRSRRAVFLYTFVGLFVPLIFTMLLGAAVMTAYHTDQAFQAKYTDAGIGGVLAHVLIPPLGRFGEFCVVMLGLSIVANNCPNIYSVGLSLQVLANETQRVPRFIWVFLGTAVYIGISIPGYSHFATWLENFMDIIGYWLAIYTGISLCEHFVFLRGMSGYNPDDYATPSRLPPSFAAVTAFCFGVMGAVLGMAQVWFIGPIGKLCGSPGYGGDVGFELAFAFSSVSYLVLRTVEKSYFRR